MSDWINRLPLIVNKIKYQLYSRKYDDLERLSATLYVFPKTQYNPIPYPKKEI
jgi:hypothetical protein